MTINNLISNDDFETFKSVTNSLFSSRNQISPIDIEVPLTIRLANLGKYRFLEARGKSKQIIDYAVILGDLTFEDGYCQLVG